MFPKLNKFPGRDPYRRTNLPNFLRFVAVCTVIAGFFVAVFTAGNAYIPDAQQPLVFAATFGDALFTAIVLWITAAIITSLRVIELHTAIVAEQALPDETEVHIDAVKS